MSAPSDFLDFLMPDVMGCPSALAKLAVIKASTEFCQETLAYTHEPTAIDLVANQRDYTLSMPSASVNVVDVTHAAVSGVEITPQSDSQLDAKYGSTTNWRLQATTGDVEHYQLTDASRTAIRLILTPAASVTAGLSLRLALAPIPTLATVDLPDFLFNQYQDAIIHGAKSYLFLMAHKPWSDPDRGAWHATQFEAAKGRGDTDTARANTRTRLRVSSHYR